MSVQVSYKKQFMFFLILLFLILIIVEGFLRYLESTDPYCHFTDSKLYDDFSSLEKRQMCDEYNSIKYDYTQPFRLAESDQTGNNHININSNGFRGSEIDFNNENYKIIFLGGSTIFGQGSTSDDTTIPGFVEKKLNEKGFEITVINAGLGGATTIDELFYLKEHILKFKPNMVVMYDGWNDVNMFNQLKFDLPYQEYLKNDHYANQIIASDFISKSQILNIGKEFRTFLAQIDYKTGLGILVYIHSLIYADYVNDISTFSIEKLSKIESNMGQNWNEVCELGSSSGFTTVNFIQPILGTSDRIKHSNEVNVISDGETYEYIMNLNFKEKLQSCENILDLRNAFESKDGIHIYFDEGHMSDFGNEIIAEKIIEHLIPFIPTK
jgi:lysophospholipase L1-like esterase